MWILYLAFVFCTFGVIASHRARQNQEQAQLEEQQRLHDLEASRQREHVQRLNRCAQLEQALRILYDSSFILADTHNVQTALDKFQDVERYLLVVKAADPEEFSELRNYCKNLTSRVTVNKAIASRPEEMYCNYENVKELIDGLESITSNKDNFINLVIKRSFEYECGTAMELKTKNGRIERIKRHAAKIKEIDGLSPKSLQFAMPF